MTGRQALEGVNHPAVRMNPEAPFGTRRFHEAVIDAPVVSRVSVERLHLRARADNKKEFNTYRPLCITYDVKNYTQKEDTVKEIYNKRSKIVFHETKKTTLFFSGSIAENEREKKKKRSLSPRKTVLTTEEDRHKK